MKAKMKKMAKPETEVSKKEARKALIRKMQEEAGSGKKQAKQAKQAKHQKIKKNPPKSPNTGISKKGIAQSQLGIFKA